MRTLLNGSHVAFDAVLNKTYKDQKEELSADAGEIIQDVQGAGEEVAFSAVVVLRCKNRLETLRIGRLFHFGS